MVVHSPPAKREPQQPATQEDVPPAVLAAAAAAATGVRPQADAQLDVPPAVLAAAAAATAGDQQQVGARRLAFPDGDLLGLQDPVVTRAEIHPERKREDVMDDGGDNRERVEQNLTGGIAREDDRISVAGSDASDKPQLNLSLIHI